MFLQADVEDIDNVLDKLNHATDQTGFLGFGLWFNCTCDNCSLIPGKLVHIREVWALATGTLCTGAFQANLRGQMLVFGERVQRHPPKLFLTLLRSLNAMPGHALHDDIQYNPQEDRLYVDMSIFSADCNQLINKWTLGPALVGGKAENPLTVANAGYLRYGWIVTNQ